MTIFLTNESQINSQKEINALICENQIEILQTTPTKMKLYLNDENHLKYLKYLKVILLGGERLTEGVYSKLRKYSSARIFNVYGPAETTVWISCKELLDDEINIGYPLANNNVYIMSDSLEVCPVGVPGELCIAGENVGLGYLNNSELTSKKFKRNPFNKNEIIYLTGDIAKWNKQSEIEYIGRKDNQVKLNGLRIELEEIENALGKIPDIISAVVILKENINRQYLVAFYTAPQIIDNKDIRQELEKYLMKYMIPSYFIKVDQLPISKNGKIDRKKLDSFIVMQIEADVIHKPSNKIEQKIHDEICRLLNVSQIDIYSNLMENGMDSLAIMELVANLDALGLYINIQSVIDNSTIKGIAKTILEYEKDAYLMPGDDQKIFQSLLLKQEVKCINRKLGNILLTGCTGFLGVHILIELLKGKTEKIFCLIREKNGISPKERFLKTVAYYFPDLDLTKITSRVVIINGDIEELNIIQKIECLNLNTIIHAAATVKHFGQYDDFERINVKATQNLVDFSKRNGIFFVYISTISVSGNSSLVLNSNSKTSFDECSLVKNQTIDNVYVRSKYEAECKIISEIEDGLNGLIIRIGNLTNRTYDMKFQMNYEENAFLSRMRAIIKVGCIPINWLENELEFSPVDEVAKAIWLICTHGGGSQFVYHVNSNKTITYSSLLKILKDINISITPVVNEKFKQELFNTLNKNDSFIAKSLIGIMTRDGKFLLSNNVKVKNNLTTDFLKKVGFVWSSIDADYLIRYVNYFEDLGYF